MRPRDGLREEGEPSSQRYLTDWSNPLKGRIRRIERTFYQVSLGVSASFLVLTLFCYCADPDLTGPLFGKAVLWLIYQWE